MIVLSGKDKGKIGKVIKAMPAEGKVIVEGVNVAKAPPEASPPGRDAWRHHQG